MQRTGLFKNNSERAKWTMAWKNVMENNDELGTEADTCPTNIIVEDKCKNDQWI